MVRYSPVKGRTPGAQVITTDYHLSRKLFYPAIKLYFENGGHERGWGQKDRLRRSASMIRKIHSLLGSSAKHWRWEYSITLIQLGNGPFQALKATLRELTPSFPNTGKTQLKYSPALLKSHSEYFFCNLSLPLLYSFSRSEARAKIIFMDPVV
jgi:hypothetical protein